MGYTVQPPASTAIDTGNTITSGLVFCAPCYEGSGTTETDIVQPLAGTFDASGVAWASATSGGGGGTSLSFTGSANNTGAVPYDARAAYSPASYTIAILFKQLSTGGSGTWQCLFGRGSIFASWDWLLLTNGGNLRHYGSSSSGGNFSTIACSQDAWHLAIGTAAASGNQTLYLDGSAGSTVAVTATTGVADSLALGRGCQLGGTGTDPDIFSGQISLACIWNRVLSGGEIASFTANAWQIFPSPAAATGSAALLAAM